MTMVVNHSLEGMQTILVYDLLHSVLDNFFFHQDASTKPSDNNQQQHFEISVWNELAIHHQL